MPAHDYDVESVIRLNRSAAKDLVLDDPVPQFDNTVAFKDALKADKDHPAYGLDKKVDEAD